METKEESGVDILEKDLNLVHIQSRNTEDGERMTYFLK
jgi:hypothetical protein